MLRVGFNARVLRAPGIRGWTRYTISLLKELSSLGVRLFLYSDAPLHAGHLARLPAGTYEVRIAPPMRYPSWEQHWLPRQCSRDRIDIIHCPVNFGLPWSSRCPRVLTLHDAIDQVYDAGRRRWYQRLRPAELKTRLYGWMSRSSAHRIITVSEHAKSDLVGYLEIPPRKITVIYEAADARYHAPIPAPERERVRRIYQLNRPYIFYVGGWERRKNVPFLVRAFAMAALDGLDLVLAGGRQEERAELARLADSLHMGDRLRLLNDIEDADLPPLYAEAHCFVYPSAYEGFGLQLCEAMAVGCPVLAADSTSLPEVLGNGGQTFSLLDMQELVCWLRRVSRDASCRADLSRRARTRAAAFSWRASAEQTLSVYQQLRSSPW